jgi:membrane associated rhomboid family serine protease
MDFSQTPVTLLLLIVNALVSTYALFFDTSLMDKLSFRPQRILEHGEYQRLITGGFVHVGLWHLAFNMMTLYFFGPVLELTLGPGKFLLLYFGAELAAHGLSLALHRHNPQYAAVGASGAVSGVVFAFCLFRPLDDVCLFFALCMPAILFAVIYVAGSIYAMKHARDQGMTGGIAHEAHVGGALGGVLLTVLLEPDVIPIFLGAIRNALGGG